MADILLIIVGIVVLLGLIGAGWWIFMSNVTPNPPSDGGMDPPQADK